MSKILGPKLVCSILVSEHSRSKINEEQLRTASVCLWMLRRKADQSCQSIIAWCLVGMVEEAAEQTWEKLMEAQLNKSG